MNNATTHTPAQVTDESPIGSGPARNTCHDWPSWCTADHDRTPQHDSDTIQLGRSGELGDEEPYEAHLHAGAGCDEPEFILALRGSALAEFRPAEAGALLTALDDGHADLKELYSKALSMLLHGEMPRFQGRPPAADVIRVDRPEFMTDEEWKRARRAIRAELDRLVAGALDVRDGG